MQGKATQDSVKRRIAAMLAQGLSQNTVAMRLMLSRKTVNRIAIEQQRKPRSAND